METLLQDIRYGLRLLIKTPGFTMVAVLSIALGISANTTIFSWVQGIVLNPIPGVEQADRIVTLETLTPSREYIDSSYPDYRDYREQVTSFSDLVIFKERPLTMGLEQESIRVWAEMVSGNFFDVLGVKPLIGRFFSPEEQVETPGAFPLVVISEPLWRNRFNSDQGILGRTILLNKHEFTVIGVVPEAFAGTISGLRFDMWTPIMMQEQLTGGGYWLENRGNRPFHLMARLKPNIAIEQARAEVQTISQGLAEMYPDSNEGIGATVVPLAETPYGAQNLLSGMMFMLLGMVGVVLLIVCANVANLLLARTTIRKKELNIRLALGARRSRVIRQILTESVLLALIGGAVGALFSVWMVDMIMIFIPITDLPVNIASGFDTTVLGFALLLVLLSGILIGLAPAIQAIRDNVQKALKESSRGSTTGSQAHWIRGGLVIAEVALASIALVCAGLFIRSFENAQLIDPGFNPEHVMLAGINLGMYGYDKEQSLIFYQRLREQMEAQPGVEQVSYAEFAPLGISKGSWQPTQVEGYMPGPNENMKIYRNPIAPGYFDVMRMPILNGRDFTEQDDETVRPVMIVNEAFVNRFLTGQNPLGRIVHIWGRDVEIVGVVKTIKYHNLQESPLPYMYIPLRQFYINDMGMGVYIRTKGTPENIMPALRGAVRAIDPNVAIFEAMTLEKWIGAAYFVQRVGATLLSVMGGLSLLLAALGLYSVMAYTVSQRTQEIGIRMALGARPLDVMRLLVRQGMLLVIIGIALGLVGALASTHLLTTLLVNVSPTDPVIFVGITILLAGIALLASYLPARKAMSVDPMVALRYE